MAAVPPDTDRNLLFAVLALQADLLTPGQFVEACTLWVSRKDTALADLLAERGWLLPEDRADLERLLERKLKKHGGDARAGLAEVTRDANVRQTLGAVPDAAVRATITPAPAGHVLVSTVSHEAVEGERYTLTRLHATGGIGRVWLARDSSLGRDVALKDLRPERAANPTVWGRFLREAQITGQLEHPGIVPVYELGRRGEDGQPFYTMRFVRGQTLREKIAAYHQRRASGAVGALELRELVGAFVGVCNAIAFAHSKGFVHRDLKPANVVCGDFGEVMVLDWGLAKEMRPAQLGPETTDASAPPSSPATPVEATLEGQVLGTPAYMAPEQADGRIAAIDARTDVYGLGAILYELLTGRAPFSGASTEEVLSNVRTLAPDRPRACAANVPRALEAICMKALAKKPDERYPGAKALADDVMRVLADEPTAAYREPLSARAWRWARRRRLLVSSFVAALVVAVPILVAGIVLLNQSESRERKARAQEEQARKDEERARERAQANYQRSLRAADALAEELARGIRPIAGTQTKTVIEILDRAKVITDDLLNDPDPTPEALERKARMLVQFTELYRDVNRSAPARVSAEQSIGLFDRLLTLRPDDRGYRIERAKARNRLGWILYDQARLTDSLAAFRASAAELEALGAESDPVLATTFLASDHTFEGNILTLFGDHEAAERAYRRGLDIRRKALAAAPDNRAVRMQLAVSLERYGAFLARYGVTRRAEGIILLREGRREMETVCASDPWDSVFHLQYSKALTNLAEYATDPVELQNCLDTGEKITERFVRRDPDHAQWQRESIRYKFFRSTLKIKRQPANSDLGSLYQLRMDEHKILTEFFAAFAQRNTEDPENLLWQRDTVLIGSRLGKSYADLAHLWAIRLPGTLARVPVRFGEVASVLVELNGWAANLAKARAHARAAVEKGEALVASMPGIVDSEEILLGARDRLWQVESAYGDSSAARIARWEYDTRRLAMVHRLAAAHPRNEHWNLECHRAYVGMSIAWRSGVEPPDWNVLGNPDVIRTLVNLATVLADLPPGLAGDIRERGADVRERAAIALRAVGAKGLLPPEGKKLIEKLEGMKLIEKIPPPREK
jgi:serine/threonine protein kinase